ncbi:MAG: hypothetical protein JWP34_4872 [Massilia sp.]|jgi:hypothetical protein|nr:hypothetical protein [Massilia sp.]
MAHRVEYLDNKTMSSGHANHCADQLTEKCEPPGGVANYLELGFYKCRKTVW